MKKYLLTFLLPPLLSYSGHYTHSRPECPRNTFESVPFVEEEFASLEEEILAYVKGMDQEQEELVEESYPQPIQQEPHTFRKRSHRPRITHRTPPQQTVQEEVSVEQTPQEHSVVPKKEDHRHKPRQRIVRRNGEQQHRSMPETDVKQKTLSTPRAQEKAVEENRGEQVSPPKKEYRSVLKQRRVVEAPAADPVQESSRNVVKKSRVQRRAH